MTTADAPTARPGIGPSPCAHCQGDHTEREHDEMTVQRRDDAATVLRQVISRLGPAPYWSRIDVDGGLSLQVHTDVHTEDHTVGVVMADALGLTFTRYAITDTYVHDNWSGEIDDVRVDLCALTRFDGWPPVNLGQVAADFELLACDWVEVDGTVSCTSLAHQATLAEVWDGPTTSAAATETITVFGQAEVITVPQFEGR